jgi:hypothetical protein
LVNAGDKDRLFVAFELKHPAKEAHSAQYFGAMSSAGVLANTPLYIRGEGNINASVSVSLFGWSCFFRQRSFLYPESQQGSWS